MKLKVGFEVFAETFNSSAIRLCGSGEETDRYLWIIDRCPVCWGRHTQEPCCHLAVGILQEGLYWVSSGKSFHVEEVQCIANGDPTCLIVINKRPLD